MGLDMWWLSWCNSVKFPGRPSWHCYLKTWWLLSLREIKLRQLHFKSGNLYICHVLILYALPVLHIVTVLLQSNPTPLLIHASNHPSAKTFQLCLLPSRHFLYMERTHVAEQFISILFSNAAYISLSFLHPYLFCLQKPLQWKDIAGVSCMMNHLQFQCVLIQILALNHCGYLYPDQSLIYVPH